MPVEAHAVPHESDGVGSCGMVDFGDDVLALSGQPVGHDRLLLEPAHEVLLVQGQGFAGLAVLDVIQSRFGVVFIVLVGVGIHIDAEIFFNDIPHDVSGILIEADAQPGGLAFEKASVYREIMVEGKQLVLAVGTVPVAVLDIQVLPFG